MNGYMQGRQYYFGFQLGTAYKITQNLSVYGGLRLLYGTATYRARISNIMVNVGDDHYMGFAGFLQSAETTVDGGLGQVNDGIAQLEAAGATALPQYAELTAKKAQLEGTKQSLNALQKYSQGVNLLCNQSSVGIAPIVSADYKVGQFNFALKYEFKTQIRMKNESTVFEASEIAAVNKFRDSEEVNEDMPALLAVGAQWAPVEQVRINAGYHHYFDKKAEWYNNAQELLDHDSNEYLAGVEWDLNDRLTVSVGGQLTRYGLSDQYMNDMSFVVNSFSFGFGGNYKVSDKVTLKAGYFQTNYDHYKRENYPAEGVSDDFTRTNRVLGIGCELNL
jgi:long-subunit fatty acid transport protein